MLNARDISIVTRRNDA